MYSQSYIGIPRTAWLVLNLAVNGLSSSIPISSLTAHSLHESMTQNWSCGATTISEPAVIWSASGASGVNRSTTAINTSSVAPADAPVDGDIAMLGDKRGLPYDDPDHLDLIEGRGVSWVYNWKAVPDGTLPPGIEYVPMCWGPGSAGLCVQDIQAAIASGSTHALSFNEPDHAQQADMTPEAAVALHRKIFDAVSTAAKIGSPAVTNGPPPMGIWWLDQFLNACGDQCRIDYVTYHWYGTPRSLDDLRSHTQAVVELAANYNISKVWLTEFGIHSGTSADEGDFLKEALKVLDGSPSVERYAYFMLTDGILMSANRLSDLGEIYTGS